MLVWVHGCKCTQTRKHGTRIRICIRAQTDACTCPGHACDQACASAHPTHAEAFKQHTHGSIRPTHACALVRRRPCLTTMRVRVWGLRAFACRCRQLYISKRARLHACIRACAQARRDRKAVGMLDRTRDRMSERIQMRMRMRRRRRMRSCVRMWYNLV
jgi:hypothetical protein